MRVLTCAFAITRVLEIPWSPVLSGRQDLNVRPTDYESAALTN